MNRTDAVPKVDYGIITIKEEEFLAVKSRFVDFRHMRGTRYFTADVRTSTGKQRTVALVRCLHQGQGDAQSVASDLIADLDPAWLLLVGIAGAVPAEEFGLGDVLLASRLHDFSVQAAIEGQAPELDVGGGRVHPSVEVLLSIIPGVTEELGPWNAPDHLGRLRPALDIPDDTTAEQYYGKPPFRTRVRGALRSRFRDERDAHRPRLRIGAVASSNSLVKDTQLVKGWKSAARSLTHIEMELGGVYRAAWRRDRITPVLSVRGISDVVGFKRESEWTDYACQTAAAFAHALIVSDLPFPGGAGAEGDDGLLPKIVDVSAGPPLEPQFKAVEISFHIDPEDLTPDLERELLGAVGRLIRVSEVLVLRRRYVTIGLTDEQIQQLRAAADSGALEEAGIYAIVPMDNVYRDPSPTNMTPVTMPPASGISAQLGRTLVREKEAHDLSRNPEFANFQFIGYRTSAAAVELVALCDADGLLEGDIVRLRDEFFDLVRRLPHDFGLKPRGRNPNGLLGFVFAEGCSEHMARFIARQTRISHAAGTGGVSVAWALDVPAGRIHTHDNPVSIFPPVIVAARTVYPGLEYLQSLLGTVETSVVQPPPKGVDEDSPERPSTRVTPAGQASAEQPVGPRSEGEPATYDVFISYASEDNKVAVELAQALNAHGVHVWLDQLVLKLGDSRQQSIDRGLANSRFGLVLVSRSFVNKPGAQREFAGLTAREMSEGRTIVLPIWHEITEAEVRAFSPPLADKVAVDTSTGITGVAEKVAQFFHTLPTSTESPPAVKAAPPRSTDRRTEPGLIHILFLAADPTRSGLDMERELERIETNLRLGKRRDQLHLKPVLAATFDRLAQAMLDDGPTIVHFSGHGREDGIILRDDAGEPHVVPIEALAELFKLFRDTIKCVVLNACWSEPQAQAIHRYIPYVIGMRERLPDTTAIAFSTGFYQAIGAGWEVPRAFEMGLAHARDKGKGDVHFITLLTAG